jgi:hypothetical protein
MTFDEVKELADLIGLGLASDFLQVEQFGDVGVCEDMVATGHADELEAE